MTLVGDALKGYADGTKLVNSGYAKTIRVIAHRNNIIRHLKENGNINGLEIPMLVPAAEGNRTELDVLAQNMTNLRNWAKSDAGLGDAQYGGKWSQLYYPAVSACYAYEPSSKNLKEGEVLAPKFKRHHWFLPSEGLLARLWYYLYEYNDGKLTEKDNSPMGDVYDSTGTKRMFRKFTASSHWSVTETSSNYSWYVHFGNGSTNLYHKSSSDVGRAVSAF
jgi:hypothetical protein